MARAFAETVWREDKNDQEKTGILEQVFGRPADKKNKKDSLGGEVVFHDAWPTSWPKLITDIVNNHHPDYYQGKDAPGDWESPKPVSFMAVAPWQEFSFALSSRKRGENTELVRLARAWLDGALTWLGAGAKTAAGYGCFTTLNEQQPESGSGALAVYETRVELVTPAFLAGALQGEEDCNLRSATLKGLLRWWWRTIYSGYIDTDQLRNLEAAIWGDTNAGGSVQVVVEQAGIPGIELFQHKERYDVKSDFALEHNLEAPPDKKTTWGLLYLAYGMDEKQKSRHYAQSGASWKIRLCAKSTKDIDKNMILNQAKAALQLLCKFGGVGSRSRKGFGSLQIVDDENLDLAKIAGYREDLLNISRQGVKTEFNEKRVLSSALNNKLSFDLSTVWDDPWCGIDQVGLAYQQFAKEYKHKEEKKSLGLPRKIHGPLRGRSLGHQPDHKDPVVLKCRKGDRYSSPVHIHFSKDSTGKLVVTITAFPAAYLPDIPKSRVFFEEFMAHMKSDLGQRSQVVPRFTPPPSRTGEHGPRRGSQRPGHKSRPHEERPVQSSSGIPQAKERVEVVLLDEKTKKGGWKAKHEGTGFSGAIVNSNDVPGDKKAGDRITLFVNAVNELEKIMSFRWPVENKKK